MLFEETEITVSLLATNSQGHYGLGEILMEAGKLASKPPRLMDCIDHINKRGYVFLMSSLRCIRLCMGPGAFLFAERQTKHGHPSSSHWVETPTIPPNGTNSNLAIILYWDSIAFFLNHNQFKTIFCLVVDLFLDINKSG